MLYSYKITKISHLYHIERNVNLKSLLDLLSPGKFVINAYIFPGKSIEILVCLAAAYEGTLLNCHFVKLSLLKV